MPFRILVALGLEIVAGIGTVVMPYLGFLFFLFWTILRPQDDRPNVAQLHYPMVLLLCVLLGTVPRMAKDQRFSIMLAVGRLYLILIYFLLMFASAVATGYTPHSGYRVSEFFVVVLTCIMLVYWGSSESRIWGVMAAFVVAGLQISRDALTRTSWLREQIGGQSFDRMNMNRLNGNFGSPNYVGLLMSVLILICLNFLYTRYSNWLKLAACGAIGMFFYVFIKANSRGASLGMAAALFAFLIFQKRKAVTVAMLAIAVIAILSFAPQAYFDRLKTIVSYEQDESATNRLELWQIGISLIRDHPLVGVGPDNFMDYAFDGPHDCYIQAAAEMGIPAAIVYCAILISGFIAGISALRLSRKLPDGDNLSALAVAALCLLAHITVQGFTTGFAHREFVYFIVACAQCTYLVARDRTKQMAPIGPSPAAPFARTSHGSDNVLPPLSYGSS
jgi:O-antigen ligase